MKAGIMIKIEKYENCSTIVEKNGKMRFLINLPSDCKLDEGCLRDNEWNWSVKLLQEIWELIKAGKIKAEEGSIFEKEAGETLGFGTKLTGFILLKPVLKDIDSNSLQLIPLYKEEISFARRMGWRRLRNMFKYLTKEELNIISNDRYNIITDIDGRRNSF